MSTTVDTRVVQMKFDNQRFRENIQDTIDSLKELDKTLKLEDSSKGLESLTMAASKVTLDPLGKSIDAVKVKFSAFEVMAITALTNITNKAVNAGERLVKSLSIDNIAAGWQKFEDTTTSVGTLISQGFSMDEVEEQLAKLNWYTDETSYNFTDMVSNIGKFTATGAKLDESVQAMMGIANWAALSGQNAQKASMAMYQLSQAMSKGVLKYDDWKSISNASMDTKEFRENAAQAAVAIGTLKRNVDGTFTTLKGHVVTLNELFSSDYMSRDAWFSKDVMMKVFQKYSSAVDDIYEAIDAEEFDTASEAIAKMGNELDSFGVKAFKAAQEARTWSDVISSVKDAVSSQWKNTFEIIVGNYEEAKTLFTSLANMLWNVFASGGEARNEMLKIWKANNGRADLLEGLAAGFWAVKDAIDAVKGAWNEIFYPDMSDEEILQAKADRLNNITRAFRDFMYNFHLNQTSLTNFTDAFKGIFSVIKLVKDTFYEILKAINPVFAQFGSVTNIIIALAGAFGRFLTKVTETARETGVLQTVATGIAKAFEIVKNVIIIIIGLIATAAPYVKTFFQGIGTVALGILAGIAAGIMGIITAAQKVFNTAKEFINIIKMGFVAPMETLESVIANTNDGLLKFIFTITGSLRKIGAFFAGIFNKIKSIFGGVIDFFKEFKGLSFSEAIEKLANKVIEIKNNIVDFFTKPNEDGKSLADTIQTVTDKFKELFGTIDVGKVIAMTFTIAMIGVAGALTKMVQNASALFGNASSLLGTVRKVFTKAYSKTVGILNIAEAFAVLAASLYLLSKVPAEDLKRVTITMGEVAAGLIVMYAAIKGLNLIQPKAGKGNLGQAGGILTGLAASIISLAGALVLIQDITFTPDLLKNLGIILGATALMGLIAVAINKISAVTIKTESNGKKLLKKKSNFGLTSWLQALAPVITLASLAGTLLKITEALKQMEGLDTNRVFENAKTLSLVLVAFGAFAVGVGNLKITSALNLLMILGVVSLIVPHLESIITEINKLPAVNNIASLENSITVMMVAITAITAILAFRGKEVAAGGKAITSMLVAFMGLMGLLLYLSAKSAEIHINGSIIAAMAVVGVIVAGMAFLSQFTEKNKMLKFAIGMTLLTANMALMIHLADLMKKLELTNDDFAPIYSMMAMVAFLEGLSALTAKSKIGSLTVIFIGLFALFGEMIALTLIPFPELMSATAAMSIVMISFAAVLSQMSKINTKTGFGTLLALVGIAGVMFTFGKMLQMLAKETNVEMVMASTAAFAAIILEVGIITGALIKIKLSSLTKAWAALIVLLGFTALLVPLGSTLILLSKSANFATVAWSALPLGIVIGEIGFIVNSLLKIKVSSLNTAKATLIMLLGFTANIAALGWSLKQIADAQMNWPEIVAATLGFSAVLIALAGAIKILSTIPSGFGAKGILILAAGLIVLAGALWLFGKAMSGTIDTFTNFANSLVNLKLAAEGNPIGTVINQITEGVHELNGRSEELYSAFYDLGVHVIAGWNDGINSGLPLVDGVGSDVVVRTYNAVKNTAMIKSPSKLFMALGEFITGGFILGIAKLFGLVEDTGEEMVEIAEEPVAKGGKIIEATVAETGAHVIEATAETATAIGEASEEVPEIAKEVSDETNQIIDDGIEEATAKMDWLSYNWKKIMLNMKRSNAEARVGLDDPDKVASDIRKIDEELKQLEMDRESYLSEKKQSKMYKKAKPFLDMIGLDVDENESLIDAAKRRISEFFKNLGDKLKEKAEGFAEKFKNGQLFSDLSASIKEWVNTGISNGTSDGKSFYEKMLEYLGVGGTGSGDNKENPFEGLGLDISDVNTALAATNITGEESADMYNKLAASISSATNAFTEFNNQMTKSPEEMLKAMESNIIGVKQWSNNLIRIAAKGIDPFLLKELSDKGPQAFAEVAAYAQMSAEQIDEANRAYRAFQTINADNSWPAARALQYAAEMMLNGTSTALDEFSDVIGTAAEGLEVVEGSANSASTAFEDLSSSVLSSASSFDEFNLATEESANDLLYNMESQIVGMSKWADNMAKLAKKGLNVNLLKELGDLGTSGYSKVAAYAKMTVEEIAEANKAYLKKNAIAKAIPEEIVKAYQYAGEMAVNGFSNALDDYSDIIDYDPLTDGLDDVVDEFNDAGEKIKSIFESVGESIASLDPFSEFKLSIEKSKDDMLEALKTNIFGVAEWSNNITRLSARGLDPEILRNLIDKGAQGSYQEVSALVQMTQEEIKEYNSLWQINNRQAASAALQVTKALEGSAEIWLEGTSKTLAEYADLINNDPLYQKLYDEARAEDRAKAIAQIKEELKDKDSGIEWSLSEGRIDSLTETVIDDLETQKKSVTKTKEHIISEYQITGEAASAAIDRISRSLDDFNNSQTNIKIGNDVIAGIETGIQNEEPSLHKLVRDSGLENADFYADGFNRNIEEFFNNLYPAMKSGTDGTKDRTVLDWESIGRVSADTYEVNMTDGISAFLDNLWPETMKPKSDLIGENLLASWEEYAKGSVSTFSQYTEDELVTFLATLYPETMDPSLTGIDENVQKKMKEMGKNSAGAYTGALKDDLGGSAPELENTGAELGRNISSGIERGIREGVERVKVATAGMVRTIDQTSREHLLINSPSKVMMEIGEYVAEGLAIGMEDGSTNVESSAYTMADMIQTAVDNALDFLNSSDSMSPVLTPILDLSQIQNGANALDSYFGTRQVELASSKFSANAEARRNAQMQLNTSSIEEAIGRYSDSIVQAIANSDKPVEVNVTLQGDSAKLFNMIRKENSKFTKVNGYNALA